MVQRPRRQTLGDSQSVCLTQPLSHPHDQRAQARQSGANAQRLKELFEELEVEFKACIELNHQEEAVVGQVVPKRVEREERLGYDSDPVSN